MPGADFIKEKLFPQRINPYLLIACYSKVLYWLSYLLITFFTEVNDRVAANCRFDCYWYMGITTGGYLNESEVSIDPKSANWGFFPFFPYLTRLLHLLLPIDERILGYALNTSLSVIGVVFLGKYIHSKYGSRAAVITVSLICFSPLNIYFNSAYSESSFFCLITALVWFIHKEKIYLVIVTASLLGLTRNTGALIAVLLIFYWQLGKGFRPKRIVVASLISSVIALPLFLHVLILKEKSGEYFAILKYHRVNRGNPIKWIFDTLNFQSPLQILLLCLFIFSLFVFIKNVKRKNFSESIIILPVLVTSLTYPGFLNWRYFLVLYPLYLEVTFIFMNNSRKFLNRGILILGPAILLFAIYSWVNNYGFMV
jgi:hypothetical protein